MSLVTFDGTDYTLALFDASDKPLGIWPANNRTVKAAPLRFVPNDTYTVEDQKAPHRHNPEEDSPDGKYGSFGIIRFLVAGHEGIGIHAGRKTKRDRTSAHALAQDHVTEGCIRTTEEAMAVITKTMTTDPLTTVVVKNNHLQGDPRRRV